MLSVPLQLFPAVRIMENGLFTRSGKGDTRVKWLKNSFRFACVLLCGAISWVGAADLDKFVAFVGCFAWYACPRLPDTYQTISLKRSQCPAMLRLPRDAALQSVCSHTQGEDQRYSHDHFRLDSSGVYYRADRSRTCSL